MCRPKDPWASVTRADAPIKSRPGVAEAPEGTRNTARGGDYRGRIRRFWVPGSTAVVGVPPSSEVWREATTIRTGKDSTWQGRYEDELMLSLYIPTDPILVIKLHTTVKVARNCSGGQLLYGGGTCTVKSPYKVGHLGQTLSDFLGTWLKMNQSTGFEIYICCIFSRFLLRTSSG